MISPPACYGKLPALGDYLRHRATGPEVGVWWTRFEHFALDSARPPSTALPSVPGGRPSPVSAGQALPWCFVLAPDVFSWAAGVHVVGALMLSRDRIGRSYPLVVWHKTSRQGLRHACLFGTDQPRNWLFWLSRLIFAHVRPVVTPGESGPEGFLTDLDALWALFRPAWTARFGVAGSLPDETLCGQRIPPCAPLGDVEGVRFMPWTQWPDLLWEPRSLCWFWQQDHEGRYLRVLRDHHFGKRALAAMLYA